MNRIDPSGHGDCPLNDVGDMADLGGDNVAVCAAGGSVQMGGGFSGGGALPAEDGFVEIEETGQAFAKAPAQSGNSSSIVYRVIRPEEDVSQGLIAKNPNAHYTPEGHVLNGSRPGFKSQYISTTTDLNIARTWADKTGNRIVEIDLTKVESNVINLSTESGRSTYLKGVTATNFAKSSSEVLIEEFVPSSAIKLLKK